jgi:hypothetical protein
MTHQHDDESGLPKERLVPRKMAAAILGCSEMTLRRLQREVVGFPSPHQVGGRTMFWRPDLIDYIATTRNRETSPEKLEKMQQHMSTIRPLRGRRQVEDVPAMAAAG